MGKACLAVMRVKTVLAVSLRQRICIMPWSAPKPIHTHVVVHKATPGLMTSNRRTFDLTLQYSQYNTAVQRRQVRSQLIPSEPNKARHRLIRLELNAV